MKFFLEGDKCRGICEACGALRAATYLRRDTPFDDGNSLAKGILVGVCDSCDRTIIIPAQSTPAIRSARKEALASIEANLPAVYIDILDYAAYRIGAHLGTDFRRILVSYFARKISLHRDQKSLTQNLLAETQGQFPEERGVTRRRLSMKVPKNVHGDIDLLVSKSALTQTEVLKALIFEVKKKVLDQPNKSIIEELKTISLIAL